MRAGIPREPEGETRVAMVPNVVPKLAKLEFEVVVEKGADALARLRGTPSIIMEAPCAAILPGGRYQNNEQKHIRGQPTMVVQG